MLLCLDVGNTQIFGGVFAGDDLRLRLRYSSTSNYSSDQHGIFLRSVLQENNIPYSDITKISICSVVPNIDYSLRAACLKYFSVAPYFLQSNYKDLFPQELGADRTANAIAGINKFPDQNLIIVDFGTATTICAISKQKRYLGGTIMPGMQLSMNALGTHAAKLFPVEIVKPNSAIGQTTTDSIQSGLYYSQLATAKEIINQIKEQEFNSESCVIIGTGGFANLFAQENLFTTIISDLVLYGLKIALYE